MTSATLDTLSTEHCIEIENLKCGGCEASIRDGLAKVADIQNVVVLRDPDRVKFSASTEAATHAAIEALSRLGYPPAGSVTGLTSAVATAKSYVSCAIGRLS